MIMMLGQVTQAFTLSSGIFFYLALLRINIK